MAERSIFDIAGNRVFAAGIDLVVLVTVGEWLAGWVPGLGYAVPILAFVYLAVLPVTRLWGTLGMLLGGLKVTDRQGGRLGWKSSAIRAGALVAWFSIPWGVVELAQVDARFVRLDEYVWPVFFLPWAIGGFRRRRESVFDLLAGAVVSIRGASPEAIATPSRPGPRQMFLAAISVGLCLALGVLLTTVQQVGRTRDHEARVDYAMQQVAPVRAAVEDFYARNHRWPSAQEIGVAEWNPYPAGGGYRLLGNGVVEITFSVVPGLKGHRISLTPESSADQSMAWKCGTDADFEPRYLPHDCREGGRRVAVATAPEHCDKSPAAP